MGDLAPGILLELETELSASERRVKQLEEALASAKRTIEAAQEVMENTKDIAGVMADLRARLDRLEKKPDVEKPVAMPKEIDLGPVIDRLAQIEAKKEIDLAPLMERLAQIEAKLDAATKEEETEDPVIDFDVVRGSDGRITRIKQRS